MLQAMYPSYGNLAFDYTFEASDYFSAFGRSVAALGDLDGDGVVDLAVGASGDDDGVSYAGAVFVLFLATDGKSESAQKISILHGNLGTFYTLVEFDRFGNSLAAPGDVDSDGVVDLAVGSTGGDDGGTDAGAMYMIFLETSGNIKSAQKISMLYGNLDAFYTLDSGDVFGTSIAAPGDIDGDGVVDLAVSARGDDDGSSSAGAVYVIGLQTNGNVKSAQKISMLYGNFDSFYTLNYDSGLGYSVAALGDVEGDGVIDLAAGTFYDHDEGGESGSAFILFLQTEGIVKSAQKISNLYGNFDTFYTLGLFYWFGQSVAALGDINGDGMEDLAVGATGDNDGGPGEGSVFLLCLQSDGSVGNANKLSALYGNLNFFTL